MTIRHLWVLLPALPFPLWNKDILTDLANMIGCFVALEKYFHLIFDKRMAKVLVEIVITKGLIPEIDIVCGDQIFTQRLDYLHLSFRCNLCHETGHLRNTCHRLRSGYPTKCGYDSLPAPDPPLPDVSLNHDLPLEDSTDIIYASSSPSTFENLSKGQLIYIEDMEVVALHSCSCPVGNLEDSTVLEPLSSKAYT